jgi:segregation and condensation protein A
MKPELTVVTSKDAPKPPGHEDQEPAQGEMPFAVVDGEPVTELPQDLYIPPYALQVFLEAFEGPLDLLLYLIRTKTIRGPNWFADCRSTSGSSRLPRI